MVTTSSAAGAGAAVVALARTKIGNPSITYVWAAPADTTAANPPHFDCSGFTAWAYFHATGKKLAHFTGTQFLQLRHRKFADAQAGDLVFFGPNNQYRDAQAIYHVGIYNGAGGIIEFYESGKPGRERKLAPHEPGLIPIVGVCPGSSSSSSSSTSSTPFAQLVSFFHARFPQLTDYELAAVAGNAQQESGITAGRQQTVGGSAYGVFQWEGPRLAELRSFAAARGMDPSNLTTELEFSAYELTHGHANALAALSSSSNLAAATTAFETTYEGASDPQMSKRIGYAQGFLGQISGAGGADAFASVDAASSPNYPVDPTQPMPAKLTAAQRAGIIAFIVANSSASTFPAASKAALGKETDAALWNYYLAAVAFQKLNTAPVTGPGNPFAWLGDFEKWLEGVFAKLAEWSLDAFVIIVGVVALVLAVVLIARSSGADIPTPHRSAGRRHRGVGPGLEAPAE
jgi:hypothetical protein